MTQEIMKMKYHPEIQDVYIGAKIRGYTFLLGRGLSEQLDGLKKMKECKGYTVGRWIFCTQVVTAMPF